MQPIGFVKEINAAHLPTAPIDDRIVHPEELELFPEPIQRYLRCMGVVGRPRVWSFRCDWTGRFRRGPDDAWRECQAWQYNSRVDLARFFKIRTHVGPVPTVAHDTYVRGHGRMMVKLFDLLKVEDATGPELDTGELVTFLNDAICLAPAMLLGPEVQWAAVDERSFDVTLTDRGHAVQGRVYIDEQGAPIDFSTTDRFLQDPADPEHRWRRTRWTTPFTIAPGHVRPTGGQAIWHLPTGDFAYVEVDVVPGSLRFNVQPGE